MPQENVAVMFIEAFVVIGALLTTFAYISLGERKLLGRFQARYGPDRAGYKGSFQPIADVVKLIFKEELIPDGANPVLFQLAPLVSVFAAISAAALIPFGEPTEWWGYQVNFVGADLNISLLFLFALSSLGFYGLILGGWASGNKYSLLGAARTAAQLVSYEVALGLSLVGVVMIAQTLSLRGIVEAQSDSVWYILFQPVGFLIFLIGAVAETNRAPFDLPEAEIELVAGYHTEYGGLKFAMFLLAEYVNMIIISALGATLFLGGLLRPVPARVPLAVPQGAALLFLFIWLRATLPRLRYDRLMKFGWKVLLPLATLNLVVTAVIVALGFSN